MQKLYEITIPGLWMRTALPVVPAAHWSARGFEDT
jgi:hypothetical protein